MKYDIVDKLIEYIKGTKAIFSEDEYQMIRSSIGLIIESPPQTAGAVFSRCERLTASSMDISWIILSLNRTKLKLENSLKGIKDPEFVLLVRQGRPSTQAIESEIRMSKDSVMQLENDIQEIDNLIVYFNSLERNIDRYIRTSKDKISFLK